MVPMGVGFLWLRHYLDSRPIEWIPYSEEALVENLTSGRSILINFKADWALSSIANEKLALETRLVRREIRLKNIVAMRADYTNGVPVVKGRLRALGLSVPAVAVYRSGAADRPLVLRDAITEKQVLELLSQVPEQ